MSIPIKTEPELEKMRVAGRLAAEVLEMIGEHVRPGISTGELNDICHRHITERQQATPAALNYKGFPASVCTSPNRVVCHGIPDYEVKLKSGDILNIDVAVIKNGWYGDTSKMFLVGGKVPAHAKRLVEITHKALYKAIDMVGPGVRLGDIGHLIEEYARANHYSVVRDFCGHGIGANFHEPPQVLHYGRPGTGEELREGMTFTIEPMLNQGGRHVRILQDGWTAETEDKKLSAQWEHTLVVNPNGCEVLTRRAEENF